MKHNHFIFLITLSLFSIAYPQVARSITIASVHITRVAGSNPSCANSPVTFAATPTNGGISPVYNWFINGVLAPGALGDTFIATSLPAGSPYIYCLMTSNQPGVTGSPARSDTIIMTVRPTPAASDSGSTVICAGSSAFITILAMGTGPFHGVLSNGANFSGAISPLHMSVAPLTDSVYTIISLSDAHCTAAASDLTDSVVVSVTPRPSGRTSDTSEVCAGQNANIRFALSNGPNWEFAFSHGSQIDTLTTSSPNLVFNFSPTVTTSYRITYIKANGCTSSLADISGIGRIIVDPLPVATIDPFGNHNQCWRNNSFSFGGSHSTARGGSIVAWSWTFGGLRPDTASGPSPLVQFLDSGLDRTVTLWVISNKGCMDSAATYISVKPMPKADFTVSDTAICKGSNVIVSAREDSSAAFVWHWAEGTDSTCHCNPASHSYTTINDKKLKLTVTNTLGCTDTSSVTVHVHALPTVSFHINDTIQCQKGNGFLFDDQSRMPGIQQYGDSIILYIWSFGNTSGLFYGGPQQAYSYPVNSGAIYKVRDRVVTDFGCTDSLSRNVIIFQSPSVNLAISLPHDTTCPGITYVLTAFTDAVRPSYRWSTGDSVIAIIRTSLNATHTSQQIIYTVTVTDSIGHLCTNSAKRTITTYPEPGVPVINSGDQMEACEGSTLHLEVTNIESNTSYYWYTTPAMPISGQIGAHSDITFTNAANTLLTVVATNSPWGCSSAKTETVNYLQAAAPAVSILELPDAVDSTLLAMVVPDGNITYQWGLDTAGAMHYIPGATTQDLLLDSGQRAINYWVIVTDTVTHCTTKKYFLSRATTTSIRDISGMDVALTVYPNPTTVSFHLTIKAIKAQLWMVEITDINGRQVLSQHLHADQNAEWQIDAGAWAPGSYLLHITSASGDARTITLIKE